MTRQKTAAELAAEAPNPFRTAVREKVPAKIALAGPSKSGKTLAALALARGLVGPQGKICVLDTENLSARLYANVVDFEDAPLRGNFHPDQYVGIISNAQRWGYDAIVIDSTTPEWGGTGGVLEIVDQAKAARRSASGWDIGTPAHNRFLRAIVECPIHLIATVRLKQDILVEKDSDGKTTITKVGLKPEQRDQFDYEFTMVGTFDSAHRMVLEARGDFAGRVVPAAEDQNDIGRIVGLYTGLGQEIAGWLDSGAAPTPAPEPAGAPTPEPEPEPPAESDQKPAAAPLPVPDPAPSEPNPDATGGTPAPQGELSNESQTLIAARVAGLANVRPDVDWPNWLNQQAREQFGLDKWQAMTDDQAADLAEQMEATRLHLEELANPKEAK